MDLLFQLFFSPDRPIALVINLVIVGLTLIAIFQALRVIILTVPRERGAIRKVRELVSPAREEVADAVAGSRTILEARLSDLAEFHARKHPVDAAALTGLTTAMLRARLALAEGISRSLVVIGLLGTLWGLGVAVSSLATTISPAGMDVGSLAQAILSTLGGLQTAFGTTLMGILGTLTAGSAVGFARARQGSLLTEIERLVSTRLVPIFDTSEASSLMDAAKALDQMERRVAEDMNSIIASLDREGAALRDHLAENFERIEDAFEHRATQLIESTGRALEATLSIIGERDDREPTLAEYVRTVRRTVEELQSSVQLASGLIPDLEQRLVATINAQTNLIEGALEQHRRVLAPLVDRQAEAIDRLAEVAERDAEQSHDLTTALVSFSAALETARAGWVDVDTKIEEVGRSCNEAIQSGLRSFVEELRGDRYDDTQEREEIARHLAVFATELRLHLERDISARAQVIGQMTELIANMRDAANQAVLQVGERLAERQDGTGRELVVAVATLSRELQGMVESVRPHAELPVSDGRSRNTMPWLGVAPPVGDGATDPGEGR